MATLRSSRATFLESLENRVLLAAAAYSFQNAVMGADGFIDGIVYSPTQPDRVFAHTDMGGAYRWDQANSTWVPLNDGSAWNDWSVQNLGVETMAIDPTDANRVYMVAGTYNSPAAILRSTDGGVTFPGRTTLINGGTPLVRANGNGNGRNGGERLVVDPNLPSTLYYGTRLDGLWKSADYGVTWNRVNAFPVTGDTTGTAAEVGLEWVLFDKNSASSGTPSQTIYVGVSTTAADKIYRSLDGGATWAAMPGQPTTSAWFPIRAALTPDGSSLLMTYANNVGPNSATSGAVYKVSDPDATTPTWATLPTPAISGGWSGISLDATNPNRMVISTLDYWAGPDDVYLSKNGGTTWLKLNMSAKSGSTFTHLDNSSAQYANSLTPHWLGDIQIDPFHPNTALVTTGYGLYRTTDLNNAESGGTVHWTFFNQGLEQSAVLELTSPHTGSVNLISAIGDRDGFRHSDFTTSPSIGRLGQLNGLAEGTSDDIDTAYNDGNYVVRLTRVSPYVQYSVDNGVNWAWMPSSGSSGSTSGGGNLAISADGTRVVYEPGGSGRVRYSVRTGSTWGNWVSTGITNQPANGAKIVADLVNAQTFYAFSSLTVQRSTDGGASWTTMTTNAPSAPNANLIRAIPGVAGGLVMAKGTGGISISTDGGATWTQRGTNLGMTANQVGVGAQGPGKPFPSIFVAGTVSGQTGFFRSDDQGVTWVRINDDAHQYGYPTVIQGDTRVYGRLYIGTNGRGVIVADLADSTPPSVTTAAFNYAAAAPTLSFTFSENVAASLASGDLSLSLTGGTSTAVATYAGYNATTQTASFTLPTNLADGDYVATLAASGVSDDSGNPMAADYQLPFFSLAGDTNHDRKVDIVDLGVLATSWQQSNRNFAQGDLNYDGAVNIVDLGILAANWQKNLADPGALLRSFSAQAPSQPSPFAAAAAPVARKRLESGDVIDLLTV